MTGAELPKAYEPAEVESRWYPLWMERGYFAADPSSTKPPYSIVIPPPNVTGYLHLGHALMVALQDVLIRWKRMSGFNCLWLPGTDHAGISTQVIVEKELKKTEKKSRHDLGREEFLKRVWAWKEKHGDRIVEQMKVLGGSLDWTRLRFTMDEGLSRAVKEVFIRLHRDGLIYRAQKLINWCPSCITALSDLEVEHQEKQGSLWHLRYPVVGEDRWLVVATTRPETMLGDTAVAIHPDDERYRGLAGKRVKLPLLGREIPIIADPVLVNMEFGTGVVKVTPGHDPNDYQTGLRHQLPMISIFDERGRTNSEAGPYAGVDRFDARQKVVADLRDQGLLEKDEPHNLSVGACQRCTTIVEPRLSPQWFVKIKPLADKAIAAVEEGKTRFVPEPWTNTYFHWMRNIHDWCISRQLWWGHQIPAYYCAGCDAEHESPLVAETPPARCSKCGGGRFEQDPDVLDTWFSSALWPFSTLGWPERTKDLQTFYPTSVMETGHDIIFFWVARMMMMGLHFMGEVPFRVVYLHALIRDEKGEKMSKTKGNVIDPLDVIRGANVDALGPQLKKKFPQGLPPFGADALRYTLVALTQQGRDIKLSIDRVAGYRAFANKLWNASRFALMNLGGGTTYKTSADFAAGLRLSLADRWILSRLTRLTREVKQALEEFQFAHAAGLLYQFLWYELCDWYIELCKAALYGQEQGADGAGGTADERRAAARSVLVYCLDHVLRLLHPFMPFITEEIWQKLPIERPTESIMLAPYPTPDEGLLDPAAEAEMRPVIAAIEGVRTIRGEQNIPPQTKIAAFIQSDDGDIRATLERWRNYLVPLAGLKDVSITPPGDKPKISASHVGERLEIYVPLAGVIDLDEERGRLKKEVDRCDADLAGLLRKLENPNFVAKAPSEVVEKDRARIEELTARKRKLLENLARIAPEGEMSEEKRPDSPLVASVVQNPETAKVTIAPPAEEGKVDIGSELEGELSAVPPPPGPDPVVQDALEKLREGTKEGLSSDDHRDLGVAYMGMGLVDEAVREFNLAQGDPKANGKAKPKGKLKAKLKAKVKAKVTKLKAKLKAQVKSKAGAKKAKPAAKKKALVKAAKKKPAKAAKKASGRRPAKAPKKAQAARKAGKASKAAKGKRKSRR